MKNFISNTIWKLHRVKNNSYRFLNRLSNRTGLFLESPFPIYSKNHSGFGLKIFIESEGIVKLGMNESYTLEVGDSIIIIKAVNDIGAIRALETLQQLLSIDSIGYYFQRLKIDDSPRFPWRGLMIDVCRHFMPMEVLKRNIDGMCCSKNECLPLALI